MFSNQDNDLIEFRVDSSTERTMFAKISDIFEIMKYEKEEHIRSISNNIFKRVNSITIGTSYLVRNDGHYESEDFHKISVSHSNLTYMAGSTIVIENLPSKLRDLKISKLI